MFLLDSFNAMIKTCVILITDACMGQYFVCLGVLENMIMKLTPVLTVRAYQSLLKYIINKAFARDLRSNRKI